MGFWAKLFGKKKNGLGEEDGQAKYFKEDFDPRGGKTAKKAEKPTESEINEEKKPVEKAKKTASKAERSTEKPPLKKKNSKVKTDAKTEKAAKPKKETAEAGSEELYDDSPEVKSAVAIKESKSSANGKFDIRRAKDGRFFFSLYASNHTVIAYSQIYSSISAVNTGIASVISNAAKADIEDTTLKKPQPLPCPKWEIYIDRAEQYRFRLYASNGLCVCHSSHGYATKSGCKGGIESIRRFAAEARVDKSYLK